MVSSLASRSRFDFLDSRGFLGRFFRLKRKWEGMGGVCSSLCMGSTPAALDKSISTSWFPM